MYVIESLEVCVTLCLPELRKSGALRGGSGCGKDVNEFAVGKEEWSLCYTLRHCLVEQRLLIEYSKCIESEQTSHFQWSISTQTNTCMRCPGILQPRLGYMNCRRVLCVSRNQETERRAGPNALGSVLAQRSIQDSGH